MHQPRIADSQWTLVCGLKTMETEIGAAKWARVARRKDSTGVQIQYLMFGKVLRAWARHESSWMRLLQLRFVMAETEVRQRNDKYCTREC